MTTLHGKEIKVGDKVWDVRKGWNSIRSINEGKLYPITSGEISYTETGKLYQTDLYPTIFWEEMILTPKPEPVYEWQWLYWVGIEGRYRSSNFFYKSEADIIEELGLISRPLIRIEESKREVKP